MTRHDSLSKRTLLGAALGLLSAALVLLIAQRLAPEIFDHLEVKILDGNYAQRGEYFSGQGNSGTSDSFAIAARKQVSAPALAIFFILTMLIGAITILLDLRFSFLGLLACGAGYLAMAFWAFTQREVGLPIVEPLFGMALAFTLGVITRRAGGRRERRLLWDMFGNHLADSQVRKLARNPALIRLGGERKFATAFFSDVKDFTTIAERLTPDAMFKQLNEYLAAMTEVLLKHGGYLDKYVGDAMVAAFGVPADQEDHALHACLAALEMQEQLLVLRKKWRRENRPVFTARIGINSGDTIAGILGGSTRLDYTVIGDAVNLAARLEGVNKMYGTAVTISEATYDLAKDRLIVRELDYIRVKGKSKPVRIYELIARRDLGISQDHAAILAHFARGLEHYRVQNWKRAIWEFRRVLELKKNDGPATEMLRRCEIFMQSPRPMSWDGVFEMHGK